MIQDPSKLQVPTTIPKPRISFPMVAGFLLILAGVISIIMWSTLYTVDESEVTRFINIEEYKAYDPSITESDIVSMVYTCAVVGMVLSIFPILGGILSLKRKLFGIVLITAIIGIILIIPSIIAGILSIVALILIIISRKEYEPIGVKKNS